MLRSYRIRNTSQILFKRRIQVFGLAILYVFGSLVIRRFLKTQSEDLASKQKGEHGTILRKLLSTRKIVLSLNGTIRNETESLCTRPSIEEFPRDIFTQTQRRYGAVLFHVMCALYMFVALAFVCDDYFISSLDKICERLDLSEDVAGATFMAAGSSAPELFTAIIGVFIAKGDVGVGTIVGSAVFNILVIIALCSLFAGQVVQLSWWPLCRDSMYYMLTIGALILILHDGYVSWYESMVMIIMYFGYILLMKLNPKILHRINSRRQMKKAVDEREIAATSETKIPDGEDKFTVKYVDGGKSPESAAQQSLEHIEMAERRRMTWKELGLMIMLTDKFSPTTRFRAACLIVIHREDRKKMLERTGAENIKVEEKSGSIPDGSAEDATEVEEDIMGTPFLYPTGSPVRVILWLLSLPLVVLMYFTIPDCRKSRWEKWYPATFFFSILWIMIFSYVMVWMVCVIGYTIGIPDIIMGITFLAAGTSIPDAISSLIVAREGMGDMAVSNSIGSNIFDILVGLAVPWFLKTAIIYPGKKVRINSGGMVYSVGLLFGSVVLTVFIIHRNNWCLDRKLGVLFIIIYLIFITLSACIEFNLFKVVNLPTCPYSDV